MVMFFGSSERKYWQPLYD